MHYEVLEQSLVELTAPQPSFEVPAALSSPSPSLDAHRRRLSTILLATRLAVCVPVGLFLVLGNALAVLATAGFFVNGAEASASVRWALLCGAWAKGEITTWELFRR